MSRQRGDGDAPARGPRTPSSELPDLLPLPGERRPWWARALCLAGALVFFALGIVGWLVPVVTGLPFYVAGLLLLGMSSDRVLGLINRADRKLPMGVRRALRHALGKVPNRRLRSRARRPDDADG